MLSKSEQAGRYRKKIKLKKIDIPESTLQEQCESYLDNLQIRHIHIPQAAYRNRRSNGLLSGIPDLIILFKSGRFLLVELKTKTGERESQRKWSIDLREHYHVLNNFNDFKLIVDKVHNG